MNKSAQLVICYIILIMGAAYNLDSTLRRGRIMGLDIAILRLLFAY